MSNNARLASEEYKDFDCDIIITDPCYVKNEYEDWDKCEYGYNFEVFGIKDYMTADTLYGDWGCHVFNIDTKEVIGQFCADAGLVSVINLDELKKYNPNIEKWVEDHNWCATIIRNFKGRVYFRTYEETYNYNGEDWVDNFLQVEGIGNVNFVGKQTSL